MLQAVQARSIFSVWGGRSKTGPAAAAIEKGERYKQPQTKDKGKKRSTQTNKTTYTRARGRGRLLNPRKDTRGGRSFIPAATRVVGTLLLPVQMQPRLVGFSKSGTAPQTPRCTAGGPRFPSRGLGLRVCLDRSHRPPTSNPDVRVRSFFGLVHRLADPVLLDFSGRASSAGGVQQKESRRVPMGRPRLFFAVFLAAPAWPTGRMSWLVSCLAPDLMDGSGRTAGRSSKSKRQNKRQEAL